MAGAYPIRRRIFFSFVLLLVIVGTGPRGWLHAQDKTGAAPKQDKTETLSSPRPVEFHLTFAEKVSKIPFTGRVFVMLSKAEIKELPQRPKWFDTEPLLARDVRYWKPGAPLTIGEPALSFPLPLSKIRPGTYSIQAIMDFDQGYPSCTAAPGNGYSKPLRMEIDPAKTGPVKLVIDRVYPLSPFKETEQVKLVEMDSKLLSAFHGRPIKMRAGVAVPKSFAANRDKRYPVVYEVPGFGGNHTMAHAAASRKASEVAGTEMIHVVLDPGCRLGHHVFADSANNGPCGRALIEEFIPDIEKAFRGHGTPAARFVTGHSSGGWSSLWLQVTYPDFFGGVWSTAPDSVDFRDFQKVNIYTPGNNMFTDDKGSSRPLARKKDKVTLHYKPFSDLEVVLGHGGQLGSFEAVFSPKGPDGQPRLLWDRTSGKIDPAVAKAWQRYDIRLVLENNWMDLGPKLAGKIHVYMGAEDNYYLDGATILLKDSLAKLGSAAVVEIFPGRDHGNLLSQSLRERIAREMAEQFRKNETK